MFRFIRPKPIQGLRRPYSLSARLTRPGSILARTTLATLALSIGALALQASNDPTQPDPDPDQPPLASLLRAYLVFSLCSFPSLVDASPRILSFFSGIPVLREVSEAFLRVTFFNQFVGAETVDGCIPLLHILRRSNQGAKLNYSAEQPRNLNEPTLDASQRALESTLHSIDIAGDFEESIPKSASPTTGTWVAIKLTTLLPDPRALRVLSNWIVHQHIDTDIHLQIPFPGAPVAQDLQHFLQSNDYDITQHIQSLRTLHTHLHKICTRARDRGIRLVIDAEETWFQPAIDLYSVLLMQEFNSPKGPNNTSTTPGPRPLVYTTLQAYLVRTPTFLEFLIKNAKDDGYSLGVKLVRGAYVDAEVDAHLHAHRDRESVLQETMVIGSGSISPDENPPTYPNKGLTDEAYDNCVRVLVGEVARDVVGDDDEARRTHPSTPGIGVLFGTHNWKSSRLVLDEILKVGLGKEMVDSKSEFGPGIEKRVVLSEEVRQRVCIAQLYGMSDSLAAYLVDRTSPASQHSCPTPFVIRNISYGPLRDVIPFLARRAVENRSVLGSSAIVPRDGSGDGHSTKEELGGGRAVEERRRVGRLIWERVVEFWRF